MSWLEKNKLSDQEIEEIKKAVNGGKSIVSISQQYGVDRKTIYYHTENSKYKKLSKKIGIICKNCSKEFVGYKHKKYCSSCSEIRGRPKGKLNKAKKKIKNYADYLKIENEKRKKQGWFLFRSGLVADKTRKYHIINK